MSKKRILIICSLDGSLINFRGDLIIDLVKNDYDVFCAAPDFSDSIVTKIHNLGASTVEFKLQRTGLNPIKDIRSIRQLSKIIQEHKIDIVFPYTIKPVIYGSIAARLNGTKVVSLITGLGFTFSNVSAKAKLLNKITTALYRFGLRKNSVVIFQNIDDYNLFRTKRIIPAEKEYRIVNGSGVNLSKYTFREREKTEADVRFCIVGRLIIEKGVQLFINAAKELKEKYPTAEFHIIGMPPENNSSAISLEQLNALNKKGTIVFHGRQNNVAPVISKCDIFTLPSYYREGVPRSILEGLSTGMPIITTDMPGCRETVISGENGFLIAPKNESALVEAMEFFLKNPEKVREMGLKSYEMAKKKFNVTIINEELLQIVGSVS